MQLKSIIAWSAAWTGLLITGVASADIIGGAGSVNTTFTLTDGAGTTFWSWTPLGAYDADGDFSWASNGSNEFVTVAGGFLGINEETGDALYSDDIVVSGNIDPVISTDFSVTNNTAGPQAFSFLFEIPVPALAAPTEIGGSVGLTLTDANGKGASITNASYEALIDGAVVGTIAPPGGTFSFPTAFHTNSITGAFGDTPVIPSAPGPAVNNSIGIRYDFTLSPGDRLGVTGVFVVVPEPASMALLAAGLGVVTLRRRTHA